MDTVNILVHTNVNAKSIDLCRLPLNLNCGQLYSIYFIK